MSVSKLTPLAAEAAQQLGFDRVRETRLDGQHEKAAGLVRIGQAIFELLRLDHRGGGLVGAVSSLPASALHGRGGAGVLGGAAGRRAERLRRGHVARAGRRIVAPDQQRADVAQQVSSSGRSAAAAPRGSGRRRGPARPSA
jgi:hypothetical protein